MYSKKSLLLVLAALVLWSCPVWGGTNVVFINSLESGAQLSRVKQVLASQDKTLAPNQEEQGFQAFYCRKEGVQYVFNRQDMLCAIVFCAHKNEWRKYYTHYEDHFNECKFLIRSQRKLFYFSNQTGRKGVIMAKQSGKEHFHVRVLDTRLWNACANDKLAFPDL